jgi:hypothetical protein
MTTRPVDMTAQQSKVNKQNEMQTQQQATVINKDSERDSARTIRTENTEGKRIGEEERDNRNGYSGEGSGKESDEQGKEERVDPMLLLPVDKGKYAQPKQHYINIEV